MSDEFNLKTLRLASGKEIIADATYSEKANVYVLEFPLAVTPKQNELGEVSLVLGRYILSGDYDHTMFLTPSLVECIAGVTDYMKEQYMLARSEYFDVDIDDSVDEFDDETIEVNHTIH